MAPLPSKQDLIKLLIKSEFRCTPRAWAVYICFALTILLWLTDSLHGMNSYVVAMIPLAVFLVSGVIGKQDLKNLSWDVLWLILEESPRGLVWSQQDSAKLSLPIFLALNCHR